MTEATHEPTRAEILEWWRNQATIPATSAGRCWGMGEYATYGAIRRDEFPIPVIKVGRMLRCRTADLIAALGIRDDQQAAV